MSQKHRLRDAFRYLKMDGNVAAAARRAGLSEHAIRHLIQKDEDWGGAAEAGRKRKESESEAERVRKVTELQNLARLSREQADQYRKNFYASVPMLPHAGIASAKRKLTELEERAIGAMREYLKARESKP